MIPMHHLIAMTEQSAEAQLLREAKDAALAIKADYTWDQWLRMSDETMIRAAVDAAFKVSRSSSQGSSDG